jgi:PAS domain S-box-containing protein
MPLNALPRDEWMPALYHQSFRLLDQLKDQLRDIAGLSPDQATALAATVEDLTAAFESSRNAQQTLRDRGQALAAGQSALEHTRRRYHALFELAPDAYLITDLTGRIQEANQAALALLGHGRAQTYGRSLLTFVVPGDRNDLAARVEAAREAPDGGVIECDLTLRPRGNGQQVTVRAHIRPYRDQTGQQTVLLWTLRVLGTKQRELPDGPDQAAAGHAAETWLDALLRTLPDPVVTIDAMGRATLKNRAAVNLLGGGAVEQDSKRFLDSVHPDDRLRLDEALDHARSSANGPTAVEFRVHAADGNWRRMSATAGSVSAGHGLEGVIVAMHDISGQRRTERDLQALRTYLSLMIAATDTAAAFTNDDELLRRVARMTVRGLADCCLIYLLDPNGTARVAAIAHRDRHKEALLQEIQEGLRSEAAVPEGPMAQVLRGGGPLLIPDLSSAPPMDMDGCLREINNQLHPISLIIVPISEGGRMVGAMVLCSAESSRRYSDRDLLLARDLAQRVALAVQNARLTRELQRVASARQAHSIQQSHELRTALIALDGALSGLRRRFKVNGDAAEAEALIDRAERAGNRLAGVIAKATAPVDGHAAEPVPVSSARPESGGIAHIGPDKHLSNRERQVIALLLQGRTNRQIAEVLVLSERTVEHHIGRMLARFRLSTRTHLAAYAVEHRLIEPPTPVER